MKSRKIILLIVVLFLINLSIMAYGFWDIVDQQSDNIIDLGERGKLQLFETIDPTVKLVPNGAYIGEGEVDEYIFEYQVGFNKPGKLVVSVDPENIRIGSSDHDYHGLAVLQISTEPSFDTLQPTHWLEVEFDHYDAESKQYILTIYVRVFVKAPDNLDDYEKAYLAIKGQYITFGITFRAIQTTANIVS